MIELSYISIYIELVQELKIYEVYIWNLWYNFSIIEMNDSKKIAQKNLLFKSIYLFEYWWIRNQKVHSKYTENIFKKSGFDSIFKQILLRLNIKFWWTY